MTKEELARMIQIKRLSEGVHIKINRELDEFWNDESEEEVKQNNFKMKSSFDTNVKLLGKQIGSNIGKKTLVLDLDETLVHSKFGKNSNPEWTFSILFNKEYYLVSTHKRPYLDEFLNKMHELFEIVFYTSSVEGYANNVIDYIDPKKRASGRLFRDSWINIKEDIYVK